NWHPALHHSPIPAKAQQNRFTQVESSLFTMKPRRIWFSCEADTAKADEILRPPTALPWPAKDFVQIVTSFLMSN
ncbi:hypothetical protein M1M06_30700, partial [Ralstonia insidiosa]|uniref:hypothetical protein n=1 Tax=Ralstonia insidiosa TaxID=190721 RepID=UPI00200A476D